MKNELAQEVLELIDKEVSLLSKAPCTIERQSILIDYHLILRYWQVKDEAEPTSPNSDQRSRRNLWLSIYRKLTDLGSESIEVNSGGFDKCSRRNHSL
jgi:hypothetical protein